MPSGTILARRGDPPGRITWAAERDGSPRAELGARARVSVVPCGFGLPGSRAGALAALATVLEDEGLLDTTERAYVTSLAAGGAPRGRRAGARPAARLRCARPYVAAPRSTRGATRR